jgi:hypothetical protein
VRTRIATDLHDADLGIAQQHRKTLSWAAGREDCA